MGVRRHKGQERTFCEKINLDSFVHTCQGTVALTGRDCYPLRNPTLVEEVLIVEATTDLNIEVSFLMLFAPFVPFASIPKAAA